MDNYNFIISETASISFTQREDDGVTINFHGDFPAVINDKQKFIEVVKLVMSKTGIKGNENSQNE